MLRKCRRCWCSVPGNVVRVYASPQPSASTAVGLVRLTKDRYSPLVSTPLAVLWLVGGGATAVFTLDTTTVIGENTTPAVEEICQTAWEGSLVGYELPGGKSSCCRLECIPSFFSLPLGQNLVCFLHFQPGTYT